MSTQRLHTDTTLRQQQRLTPLQVQFVRMLEMSAPEMEDEVARALSENPALEAIDATDSATDLSAPTEDGSRFTESAHDMQRADFAGPDEMPDYLDSAFTPSNAGMTTPAISRFDAESAPSVFASGNDFQQEVQNSGETLLEALARQIAELSLSDTDRTAALYIAGSLDGNGYLTRSIEAMADDLAINEGVEISHPHLEQVLKTVQQLDPPGVAAANLRECLLLQVMRKPRTTESITATEILLNHFDLLSKRHFDKIASALDISRPRADEAISLIAHLNPKPGNAYISGSLPEASTHISPDFLVEADANGHITISSLSRLPRLRVEPTFNVESPEGISPRQAEAWRFLRAKRDDARNFIRVVEQRQDTLGRVVEAIVNLQSRFFISEADEDIKPMVLRDIAWITGFDISVVSRATQGKYIATLRGVYPLKKFFNEKLRANDNEDITSNRIIAEIKHAIDGEDKTHPLSDREITARLAAAGYDIARRTVAKYRENLGFPVARLRRN